MPQYGVIVGGVERERCRSLRLGLHGRGPDGPVQHRLLTLLAAPIAGIALGRRDPLHTVWEHQDERAPAPAAVSG